MRLMAKETPYCVASFRAITSYPASLTFLKISSRASMSQWLMHVSQYASSRVPEMLVKLHAATSLSPCSPKM